MILIFSHPDDVHTQAVQHHLRDLRAQHAIIDLSDFPQNLRVVHDFGAGGDRALAFEHTALGRIGFESVQAAWWRRPQPYQLHEDVRAQAHREFAFGECYEAMTGSLYALETRWVNHPLMDDAAHRKLMQLRVAQQVGLTVPETLVTNDPDAARRFVAGQNDRATVYKSFSATERAWRETRVLRRGETELLDSVCYAPVIFQDYIEAEVDLRVTVIGDRVFPAAIHSQQSAYKVDFRMDMDRVRITPDHLPQETVDGLLALMRRLDLVYGAIDLRRTPDGRLVFLEINPAGQWLFFEQQTRQPIARTLAEYLAAD